MLVRVLISNSYPEYRLVLPAEAGTDGLEAAMRAVIEQMGEWEERSQDDLDGSRPEHRSAMEGIASHGACLWMVSATYTGRVDVVASGTI